MKSLRHQISAPLERVWRAWTDASSLCQWDPDRVEGEITAGQSIVMHWDSLGASTTVDVLSRIEEEELVLRSLREGGVVQELDLRLHALGNDCTELSLQVRGTMSEDEKLGTLAGWYVQLRVLERYLLLGSKKRTSFAAFGSVLCSSAEAFETLRNLGNWLATETCEVQKDGQNYSIQTLPAAGPAGHNREGLGLRGEVIAHVPGREFALWCEELWGVIRARVLPLAFEGAKLVGVQVIRWGDAPNAEAIQDALQAGVDVVASALSGPSGTA